MVISIKIAAGYVKQLFDTETGVCVSQEFIADSSGWEDNDGNPMDCPESDPYHPFDMVLPD